MGGQSTVPPPFLNDHFPLSGTITELTTGLPVRGGQVTFHLRVTLIS
jgi:hypothetical protein